MNELTSEQIARQDEVDNAIMQLLSDLAGRELPEWNIALIGKVRDAIEDVLCPPMTRQEFYPYIEVDEEKSGRFLLFSGYKYYPKGGWQDCRNSYDSLEEAKEAGYQICIEQNYDWWQVVDTKEGEIVATYGQAYEV